MRKIKLYFMCVLFAWSAIIMPGRVVAQTQTGVMVAAVGVLSSIATNGIVQRGVAILGGPVGSIAALAVGAAIAGVYLQKSNGETINILPKSKATDLEASLASSGTGTLPIRGATMGYGCDCGGQVVTHLGDIATVCAASAAKANTCNCQPGGYKVDYVDTATNSCHISMANGAGGYYPPYSETCPSGKTLMPDGKCYETASSASEPGKLPQTEGYKTPDLIGGNPILRDVSTAKPTDLPQGVPLPVAGSPPIAGPAAGSAAGNPSQTITFNPTADGGLEITKRTYDGTTNTTKVETVRTNSAGTVVNNSTQSVGGNVINNITYGASSGGEAPTIPTDYNRESTQQAISSRINDLQSEAKTDREQANAKGAELTSSASTTVSGLPLDGRWTKGALGLPTKDDFQAPSTSNLPDALPGSDGSCVKIDLPLLGNQIQLDPCPVVAFMRPIMDWAFILGAVISTWFFILGRREEA